MQKLMFNDEFLLTTAVEEGEKTMTRRIIPEKVLIEQGIEKATEAYRMEQLAKACPFKVGEIVAVAMSYSKAEKRLKPSERAEYRAKVAKAHKKDFAEQTAGWGNKMFVRADLMPVQIRILAIKATRLKDIHDDECLKEGIMIMSPRFVKNNKRFYYVDWRDKEYCFDSLQRAFRSLIMNIEGRKIYLKNPLVWAIEFELVSETL